MSRSTGPRNEITAHSTSLICQDVDIRGNVTIGPGVVIHQRAAILALEGPIILGQDCIVEENAIIINRSKEIMRIGERNHFMVACRIESPSIGDFNTFQPRCKASFGVVVTHHCTLSASTILLPLPDISDDTIETLPPYTIIYGQDSDRRTWDGSGQASEMSLRAKHIEYLREVIPKYNRLRVV